MKRKPENAPNNTDSNISEPDSKKIKSLILFQNEKEITLQVGEDIFGEKVPLYSKQYAIVLDNEKYMQNPKVSNFQLATEFVEIKAKKDNAQVSLFFSKAAWDARQIGLKNLLLQNPRLKQDFQPPIAEI